MKSLKSSTTTNNNSSIKEEKKKEERRNVMASKKKEENNMPSNDAFLVANSSDELTESVQSSVTNVCTLGKNQIQSVDTDLDPISFSHLETEMIKTGKAVVSDKVKIGKDGQRAIDVFFKSNVTSQADDTFLSAHQESEMNDVIISQKLETIHDDPSELFASYACTVCGVVTKVRLGTPLADISCGNKVKINDKLVGCDRRGRLTRIYDPEDPTVESASDAELVSDIENRVPIWKNVFITGCTKCGGHIKPQKSLNVKTCHCENPEKVIKEIFLIDDNRGLGSFDERVVIGITSFEEIMKSLHQHTEWKNKVTGQTQYSELNRMDKTIDNIHKDRLLNDDVFNEEQEATSIMADCQAPMDIQLPDQYMEMPELKRRIRVLFTIPETKQESELIKNRNNTKMTILANIAKKESRILLSEDQKIDDFQINTVNKHLGVKPQKNRIGYEQLASAMKTFFWASDWKQPYSKYNETLVHTPQAGREDAFNKAKSVIIHSARLPEEVAPTSQVEVPVAIIVPTERELLEKARDERLANVHIDPEASNLNAWGGSQTIHNFHKSVMKHLIRPQMQNNNNVKVPMLDNYLKSVVEEATSSLISTKSILKDMGLA